MVANTAAVKYYTGEESLPEVLIAKVDFVACANALKINALIRVKFPDLSALCLQEWLRSSANRKMAITT